MIHRSILAGAVGASLLLGACANPQPHGYVLSESALAQIPVGSSQDQVLLVLGSPSTTSTVGGQAYYYISQTIDDNPVFGRSIDEQRVLAIYFDEDRKITEIANYGLQDGVIFDFISRRTRTSGRDLSFIAQILSGVGRISL
jgi:outer membrane protein assembly factor BamE (lipoprotein component of BamABCDE complex)